MMKGYVMPCCAVMMSNNREFLREHSLGNVFENHFREIWYSERYTRFRKTVNDDSKPVPALCAGCRAFETKHRIETHGVDDTL